MDLFYFHLKSYFFRDITEKVFYTNEDELK